jgi:pimeloyl-ACP methyl ester carboxylesterase
MIGGIHTPIGPLADTGVVVVSPLGRDGRCVHMPMRVFADQLAAAGYPTLRFDPRGAGDSLDRDDETTDALPEWLAGIEMAVEELRALTGVERVVLAGMRLGGSLAALSGSLADGLMLLAPILNGRSWLRQLRFSAEIRNVAEGRSSDNEPLDADGCWLSSLTVASLSRIDLPGSPPLQGAVFIAAQNRQVLAFARSLAEANAAVRSTDFPGFRELFLESADNLPPEHVFERARDWMVETFGPPLTSGRPGIAQTAVEPTLHPPGAVERFVTFGEDLRGVLCLPDRPAEGRPAALFLNSGGDPRAGVGGFAAQAARHLANEGVASLRFDFAGIGESAWHGSSARCHVFETPRETDIDAAMALLAEWGHSAVATVGLCSGAYHALRAAWRISNVEGVCAINPSKIVWNHGDTLTYSGGRYRAPMKVYAAAMFNVRSWKMAHQRGINVIDLALVLTGRLKSRILGWAARQSEQSPLTQTERFLRRGGQALFVMGQADGSVEEMETYFGPRADKLAPWNAVSVRINPELDHGLVRRKSRDIVIGLLTEWLAAWPTATPGRQSPTTPQTVAPVND